MELLRSIEMMKTRSVGLRRFRQFGNVVANKLNVAGSIFAKHCEFIATQRIRRACQICLLYSRLYSEATFRNLVTRFATTYGSRLKCGRSRPLTLLLGTAFFSWEKEKITEDEMKRCAEDLTDTRNEARNANCTFSGHTRENVGWETVINREHLKVWRKPISNSYLYEYKVCGTFYDIPARAFFDVQLDIDYRKKWDKLVVSLDIVEKDEKTGCEVVHWVMHYPFPMYSRDYVYIRRYNIDPANRVMVLVSKSTNHPSCPITDNYVRVKNYSSSMVIKPHSDFDDNGFDYVLTYFDNPQAMIPGPAYNWMASSGVPEFVEKLHQAAITLQSENGHALHNETATADQQKQHQAKYHRSQSEMVSSMPVYA